MTHAAKGATCEISATDTASCQQACQIRGTSNFDHRQCFGRRVFWSWFLCCMVMSRRGPVPRQETQGSIRINVHIGIYSGSWSNVCVESAHVRLSRVPPRGLLCCSRQGLWGSQLPVRWRCRRWRRQRRRRPRQGTPCAHGAFCDQLYLIACKAGVWRQS